MPHSEVPKIQVSGDGSTVTLDVRVTGFEPGTPVEISGYATQANGAIATFYKVDKIPEAKSEDGTTFPVEDVQVFPPDGFKRGEPITVVARAADVWITRLDNRDQGLAWNSVAYHSAWDPDIESW